MIIIAVADVAGVGHVHNPVHQSQSTAFFLYKGIKGHAVVRGRSVHIHWPVRSRGTSINVQRKNKMLHRTSIDHRIEEKSSGGEIDNRCAGNTIWRDVTRACAGRRWRADVNLPDH